MIKKPHCYLVFIIVFLYSSQHLTAQEPYFSQFYANLINLNPAYAGFDPGGTITLNYRDQWLGIPDGDFAQLAQSYRTLQAAVDFQMPCLIPVENISMGIATLFSQDAAGSAPMITRSFGTAFSMEVANIESLIGFLNLDRLDLRFGTQISWRHKELSSDYLIFSNQLDPVVGLLEPPVLESFTSGIYPAISTGIMLRGYKKMKMDDLLFTAGINFSNINEPEESLLNLPSGFRVPMRTTIHVGVSWSHLPLRGVMPRVAFAPQFRAQLQKGFELYTMGAFIQSRALYLGAFYQMPGKANDNLNNPFLPARNTKALILNVGGDIRTLMDWQNHRRKKKSGIVVGLSYDFNFGGLNTRNTLGVLELNCRINLKGRDQGKDCGSFGRFEQYNGQCPVKF